MRKVVLHATWVDLRDWKKMTRQYLKQDKNFVELRKQLLQLPVNAKNDGKGILQTSLGYASGSKKQTKFYDTYVNNTYIEPFYFMKPPIPIGMDNTPDTKVLDDFIEDNIELPFLIKAFLKQYKSNEAKKDILIQITQDLKDKVEDFWDEALDEGLEKLPGPPKKVVKKAIETVDDVEQIINEPIEELEEYFEDQADNIHTELDKQIENLEILESQCDG